MSGAATPAGPIDSHCHLQLLAPEACERALDEARARGVRGFLVPAIRLDDAERLFALCERHADVWCALGVHPHDASTWRPGDAERLRRLLAHPRAVAVGECGLDFHYDRSPRDVQQRALREQWEVAVDLDLPVVVHNRESNREMLAALREPAFAALAADFHSYAGGVEMAAELLERGFYLGLSGMLTFPRADNVRAVLAVALPERLLVETDAPYLAPVPHRGEPNRPAWVVEVAERLAAETGASYARTCEVTSENFFRLFRRAA